MPAPLPPGHRRNPLTTRATGGRLLSASQLGWFTLLPPRGFGVLTTRGRTTGKLRHRCVRVIHGGSTAYLTAIGGEGTGWLRNLRADPAVQLRLRTGHFDGLAREVAPHEHAAALRAYCETVNPLDRAEYLLHMRGRPTPERIRQLHEHWFTTGSPVAIELMPADGRVVRALDLQ
jgi:deazaflavin-dependent oxidoreductase (nitroreductase family)